VQYTNKRYENTIAQGTGFITTAATNVGSATTRNSWDEFAQVKSLGFFVQEQVAWRDRLYLTGAVREDNSSVFGSNIHRLYYPKLSAAYVVSEEPFMRKFSWLDNLKLRFAWGQAGNAPDPFAKDTTFTPSRPWTRPPVWSSRACGSGRSGTRTSSRSAAAKSRPGSRPRCFGNRLGVEFTYYHKATKDALMYVPLIPSVSPGVTQIQNVGEITNTGIELSILATPMRIAM